jgi:hypothetical protein
VQQGFDASLEMQQWAVWEDYFIWAGNHGTRRISKFYPTAAEARTELERMNVTEDRKNVIYTFIFVFVIVIIIGAVILSRL